MNKRALAEVARLFLKLGALAFGGPAAHVGLMEDEVVSRRKWMSREHFLDLVGATNLIPGPNSTEMTMHIGFERAGWKGLMVAGSSFILPAVLITGILAWFYVQYGAVPQMEPVLAGMKPAVIAVIGSAVWRLGKKAIKNVRSFVLAAILVAAVIFGADEIQVLFIGGIGGMLWFRAANKEQKPSTPCLLPIALLEKSATPAAGAGVVGLAGVSVWKLGLFFLKVGAILYGSGYVLVAFIEGGLVEQYGWISRDQLLDAIAIGQFTPGPVLCTATFIGYVIAGAKGAVVATLGIFLPSYFFVLLFNPLIPRLRQWVWTSAFLDAVNVAAIALMAAVVCTLSFTVLTTWQAWTIALGAILALVRFRISPVWIIPAGGMLGFLLY
jgi:chromate transporter